MVASYTDHVLRVVAHLVALEARTGRIVQLALEPEPFCFLETTDETVAYFTDHLYSGAAVEKLARLARMSDSGGERGAAPASRHRLRHLPSGGGVREHPASLQKLTDAGIPIFKLQEAAALHIPEVTQPRRRHAQALRQDHLSHPDAGKDGRQAHALSQCRRRHRRLRAGSGAARMAHAHPRPGLPRRSRAVPHHALRHRGGAALPQGRSRCRGIWKSRPTPGTCCRTA